jgi:hypothetical protein
MADGSDRLGSRVLPRTELATVLAILAAPAVAASVWAFVSTDHSALQLVLVTAATAVGTYSIFFLRLSLRRLRALRRLYEEGARAQAEPNGR